MRYLFGVVLCLAVSSAFATEMPTRKSVFKIVAEIEEELLNETTGMPKVRKRVDAYTDRALKMASFHLREKGAISLADNIDYEWETYYGGSLFEGRGIGAHKPVWKWLAEKYETIEAVLGRDFCVRTHIASLKTFNFTPTVVFNCNFEMDGLNIERKAEYRKHFCGGSGVDEEYWGLVPELTYWAVYIGVSAATAGTGFVVVSGLVGNVAEKLMALIADDLSDRVFDRFCGGA